MPLTPWHASKRADVQRRDTRLTEMWEAGLATSVIAAELGYERKGAVSRRAHDLGLKPRSSTFRPTVAPKSDDADDAKPSLAPTPGIDGIASRWRFSVADERAGRAVSAKLYALERKRAKAAAKQAGRT